MEQCTASPDKYDVVIVGGGPAGLSAALTLGRSRRRVLIAGAGPPRNAPAEAAHNVFTRDGTPPPELLHLGREQLAPYGVVYREEHVASVEKTEASFRVVFQNGGRVEAARLLLATGVRDVLPDIPGFQELWGRSVFHCPYCHGWEVAGWPLAVYGSGQGGYDFVALLRGWSSDLILFTDGPANLTEAQRARLRGRGVGLREEKITRLQESGGQMEAVVLATGEAVPRRGLFVRPAQELRSALARQLGCPLTADGRIAADEFGKTGVAGVYVAGDTGPFSQQIIAAAASGVTAAAHLNHELLREEFEV
jgi:thioredoxin reductase